MAHIPGSVTVFVRRIHSVAVTALSAIGMRLLATGERDNYIKHQLPELMSTDCRGGLICLAVDGGTIDSLSVDVSLSIAEGRSN